MGGWGAEGGRATQILRSPPLGEGRRKRSEWGPPPATRLLGCRAVLAARRVAGSAGAPSAVRHLPGTGFSETPCPGENRAENVLPLSWRLQSLPRILSFLPSESLLSLALSVRSVTPFPLTVSSLRPTVHHFPHLPHSFSLSTRSPSLSLLFLYEFLSLSPFGFSQVKVDQRRGTFLSPSFSRGRGFGFGAPLLASPAEVKSCGAGVLIWQFRMCFKFMVSSKFPKAFQLCLPQPQTHRERVYCFL